MEIRHTGKDRYGRTLARVIVDAADVTIAMVKAGMAWRLFQGRGIPEGTGCEVGKTRRGLWADPAPMAPWQWRE